MQLFIAMHDEQVIQHTQPYPDVIQVLKQLHDKNIPMAVATNKRLAPTKKLINHFGWNHYFEYVECSDSKSEIRNKDMMIKDIINKNPSFRECFFIGDTLSDGLNANINKLKFIYASYGYGSNQNWSDVEIHKKIESIKELIDYS